ncbi:hypothetical protein RPO_01295 [Rickettsia rickettsii str. Arizona]|uniref:Uncharacterized protein n=3 Tax=spotted fever group TaxID=114277 RepID=B0BWG4_RICRO|nr:alpha-ketoglutarate decarboxylase [Rickettsia rickettsii str. 'Sheila Smith']ABY72190.1 hypothetical protein RrIowa_0281 [Rickettsia rickettsii str. Iowa]AFB22596.1 hypothetical protein RPN_05615 [Rickettsia rickettsii str. Brazil]AFB23168.1 hypothetical protein RPL_01285 [Rickettsia rickettsii str. Colombia]AFB24520.1 hypothetical protein RPO_01295 [Rickettsia rickettsii str. Arizona]AFB25855.1 hypothetical protein RSA_01245 [Rickettsia philipii str. 364D]AFB27206.1 hypothetical protein R
MILRVLPNNHHCERLKERGNLRNLPEIASSTLIASSRNDDKTIQGDAIQI